MRKKHPIIDVGTRDTDSLEDQVIEFYRRKMSTKEERRYKERLRRVRRFRRFAIVFMLSVFVMGLSGYGAQLYFMQDNGVERAKAFYQHVNAGMSSVAIGDFAGAQESFSQAQQHIAYLDAVSARADVRAGLALAERAAPGTFRGITAIPALVSSVEDLNALVIDVTRDLRIVKEELPRLLLDPDAGGVTEQIATLDRHLGALQRLLPDVQRHIRDLQYSVPPARVAYEQLQSYFIQADRWLAKTHEFLSALERFLETDGEKHFLITFQNPSEMRAAGGFIGSYAHLTIRDGAIRDIDVRDIYDPDGQLHVDIIPPRQMQSLTTTWGARDANWFFDFPTSMERVMSMLETSLIYAEQDITFHAGIAINTHLIEDLLDVVGPIEMPEYDVTLTSENFLEIVQSEVEAGDDKYELGQPKRILMVMTPILLERLSSLEEVQQRELLYTLAHRAYNKDIQVYFRNPTLQDFIKDVGIAGELFPTPRHFQGDYLGVVNTNIAGGKTDILMEQKVQLTSFIETDGAIRNSLKIIRHHTAANTDYSWYRQVNQNYIRTYTHPSAELINVNGFSKKRVWPLVNYNSSRFVEDPVLGAVEDSHHYENAWYTDVFREGDKRVFGTWLNVGPRQERTLDIEYALTQRITVGDGEDYVFVLEKQSGVESEYDITIHAPPGYYWKETGGPSFIYEAPEVFSRDVIRLTMVRLPR